MTLIPRDQWTSCIDPTDPSTLNDNGQFSTAGCLWQRGDSLDWMSTRYGYTQEQGFDLSLVNGRVDSFAVEGNTLRAGMVPDQLLASGRAFLTRQYWTSHPTYQIGGQLANGANFSIPFPGGGDRLRFDGTRTDKAVIPENPDDPVAIRASRDGSGDVFNFCHVVQVQDWMFGNHMTAMAGAVHAHFSPRSPFTVLIGQGKIQVITRTTKTILSTGQQPPGKIAGEMSIPADWVGRYMLIVHDGMVDPNEGHLITQVAGPDLQWRYVVDQFNGMGYIKSDSIANAMFFAKLGSTYAWHNESKYAPQNWDLAYGALRPSRYGWSGVMIDQPEYVLVDMQRHAEAILAPVQPENPNQPDLLTPRVDSLETRMDNLEALIQGIGVEINEWDS